MVIDDINFILFDFPTTKLKGTHTVNPDGSYTVFINSRLNYETQLEAAKHELRHIALDHFYQDKKISFLEQEANK